jgi:NADH:ubiquinone oxidoreductase subunit 2 (subunit N)
MLLTLNDLLAMTPQLLLVVGGLVVLTSQILIRGTGGARIAWNLTLVTLIATAIVVAFGLSDAAGKVTVLPQAFLGSDSVTAVNNTFRYTTFSANAILLFVALAIVSLIFMRTLLPALNIDFAENYFLLLMSLAGYAYAICAEDLITLFVGLELGSIPVIVLIGMNRESRAANEACSKVPAAFGICDCVSAHGHRARLCGRRHPQTAGATRNCSAFH